MGFHGEGHDGGGNTVTVDDDGAGRAGTTGGVRGQHIRAGSADLGDDGTRSLPRDAMAAGEFDHLAAARLRDHRGGLTDALLNGELRMHETGLACHRGRCYRHGASSLQPGSGFAGVRPGWMRELLHAHHRILHVKST